MTTPGWHVLALLLGCRDDDDGGPRDDDPIVEPAPPTVPDTGTETVTGPTDPIPGEPALLRLVLIADFGSGDDDEAAVAALADALAPAAILTAGDNNYDPSDGFDARVGQFYQQWMYPYTGVYGAGSPDGVNRFWPCLGNHDWDAGIDDWYLYFELPGNERYWSVPLGDDPDSDGPLVEWFCVDSDVREPDGVDPTSLQATWLRDALAASTARWKVVGFHHPSWSSGIHGDNLKLQWPWLDWGADLVLTGHDHLYEKVVRDGFVHLTDGRGGMSLYRTIGRTVWSEQVFDAVLGLTVLDFHADSLVTTTLTTDAAIADRMLLYRDRPYSPDEHLVRFNDVWRWRPGAADGNGWREPGYDDAAWATGQGQLGFGEGDESTRIPAEPVFPSHQFRLRFDLASVPTDPLELHLVRDDGAAVFLNGVEIVRDNLPAGDLAPNDLALTDLLLPTDEEPPVVVAVDPALLTPGQNVLAVEVHHAATGSQDLSFDLALRAVNPDRLVPEGATWSYRETPPPAGWQQPAFDAAGWATGAAPLGYGHAVLATALAEGDPLARPPAAWFRTTFEVQDPADLARLWVSFLRDDGVVLWLNGREVHRTNMPAGPPDPLAYALSENGLEWADVWASTFLDPSGLVAGTNVLAAEVHQGAAAGVDLRFDLRLIGLTD